MKKRTVSHNEELKSKYEQQMKEAITDIALTESGVLVLKHLSQVCGFGKINTVYNTKTGDFCSNTLLYNAAMQNVYLNLRQFMTNNIKKKIELSD